LGSQKVSIEGDSCRKIYGSLRKCAEADLIKFALVWILPQSGFRWVTFDFAALYRCVVTSTLHVILCGINQRRCGII